MRDFVEFYSNEYDEDTRLRRHPAEFASTTYVLDRLIPSGSRILDIGAGTGAYSLHYARKGCSVFAVDAVQKYIEILQAKTQLEPQLDIQAEVADIRHLSIALGNDYDVVLFMGPIYHLPRPEAETCLDFCLGLLKENGLFAASYVNRQDVYQGTKYPDLFVSYTPSEIADLLDKRIELVFHGPTDGEVFGELNCLSQSLGQEIATMHTWLHNNETVFRDSGWVRTSPHGLYVGRKAPPGIQS